MKVILLDNIRGIGRVGDVKEVNDGYARNYLLPRKLARAAGAQAQKEADALKARLLEASALAKEESAALAARIEGLVVPLVGRANEKGTLFAGIEAHQIADALSALVGAHLNEKDIELSEHLKTTGDHEVPVRVGSQRTTITVRISA